MDGLHENIAVYTHSGSAPCVQAAKGERMVGIGFDMRGASEKTKGAPIDLDPAEGRRGLGHGSDRDRQGHQEPRAGQEGRRLGRQQAARTSSTRKYYALVAEPDREERAAELSGRRPSRRW